MSIENVSKRYGDKTVLQNVTLQVQRGQFVALLGPSGCGKTTLLNALAGLVDLDDGHIEIDGRVLSTKGHTVIPEQRNVGMVFQDFALWPHMNVFDNVAFGLKIRRAGRAEVAQRVREVLEAVRMEGYETRFPHQLSGGQKQRVAIARALAPAPSVLLLDEPLSSLDAKLREEMRWELLHIIGKAQITAIDVTHDQIEALSMADHVVVLNGGKIEQQGAPTAIYQRPATLFTAAFLGASNVFEGAVVARAGEEVRVDCGHLQLRAIDRGAAAKRAIVAVRPTDILLTPEEEDGACEWPQHVPGSSARAVIRQRAFHGVAWQYRLEIEGGLKCEVWHPEPLPPGMYVRLFFPLSTCHTVAN